MLSEVLRHVKTSFAALGVIAAAGLYTEYRICNPSQDENEKQKKVLVIPFHRMQLVEHKGLRDWRSQMTDNLDPDNRTITLEVRELVDLLHEAAADPNIVALYGIFGHGSKLAQTGWADLEEVRSALRVFREAHRRHPEPNLHYGMQVIPRIESKPLYAYSDSFLSPADPPNKEYYLASIFTHIHLQQNGELNLLGMLSQKFFLRDFLNKYGITVHVFKHGEYKNFPNMFTERKLNRAHRENVTHVLEGINSSICEEITHSRSRALLTSWLKQYHAKYRNGDDIWKRVHESGTFPARTAWQAGLIDYIPRRDPLPDLLQSNESGELSKDSLKSAWQHQETDFDKFKADKAIQINVYAKQIAARKRKEEWLKFLQIRKFLQNIQLREEFVRNIENEIRVLGPLKSTRSKEETGTPPKEMVALLHADLFGPLKSTRSKEETGTPPKEKVALLYAHAESGITDTTARKLVTSIRKIRKDPTIKCVVLRVDSPGGSIHACETVHQELKGLGVPLVVSFGNVSASGGYYVSSGAARIFASNKTVTGSIGVFGMRLDLTEIARQYGISIDHVASGDLAAIYSPFHPMTPKMRKVFGDTIDRYYSQFKNVVADGRQISLENVESIAKGRVWTGSQAKDNGLVDEIGGLHRALSFAQRTYTTAGSEVEVVVYPRELTFWERFKAAEKEDAIQNLFEWMMGTAAQDSNMKKSPSPMIDGKSIVDLILTSSRKGLPGTFPGVFLTVDENAALRCLVNDLGDNGEKSSIASFPPSFWD